MKHSRCCPKCHSENIVRVPDNPARHASGNNIYTTNMTLLGKIPVIRYDHVSSAYAAAPKMSKALINQQIRKNFPEAAQKELYAVLGWSR